MSREIKFRAKRIDMDRWVYGDYFKTPLTDENSKTDPSCGWFYLRGDQRHCIRQEHGVSFVIDINTLGQFTGKKDMKGNDLYESDVVLFQDQEMEVKWNAVIAGFGLAEFNHPIYDDNYLIENSVFVEIIGNVYDGYKCPECNGEGTVPGKTGGSEGIPEADVMFVCNECGGSGKIKNGIK